jgi:hypothetical protein
LLQADHRERSALSPAIPPSPVHIGRGPEHDRLNTLLGEFGRSIGIPELRTNELGACTLIFDQRIDVHIAIDPTSRDLILWCELGPVAMQDSAAIFSRLLRANLFWQKTLGATLSLMPDSEDIVLARRYPMAAMTAAILRSEIEALLEAADAMPAILDPDDDSDKDAAGRPDRFV